MIIFYVVLINLSFLLFGYLIGSANTSVILSKYWKKNDVRDHFSQNGGATNSLRVFGKNFALIVLLIDVAKTFSSVYLCFLISALIPWKNTYTFLPLLAGLGCILGHVWPVFFKFKGGKGVACTIGFIIAIDILLLPIGALIFLGIYFKTKYVSLASIVSGVFMILYVGAFAYLLTDFGTQFTNWYSPWYSSLLIYLVVAFLIVFMHRTNIQRLIKGKESKTSI